jgi:hypothetical protein
MRTFSSLAAALAFALAGCAAAPAPAETAGLALEVVTRELSDPLYLTAPPADPRLFVVEQAGRIRIIRDGALLQTPFLDIRKRASKGGERGLFSVAFHPDYAVNGYFYVNYTEAKTGHTRVERYRVGDHPDRADPGTAKLVLKIEQPYANHNGGHIAFGPDGMLYIAMGDGGSGGDPKGHGQNRATLLGALLRIDVDRGEPYAIPADNPFADKPGARGEIWAYGLRNPWRFAFDREAGRLYIADVGQNAWEEVNATLSAAPGLNYGWNVMEGAHCYPAAIACESAGLVLPIMAYGHDDGCSITGGYVYRGGAMPALRGHYFYADYCSGFLRSFRLSDGKAVDRRQWAVGDIGNVTSFGEDARGELYIISDQAVFRLRQAD